MFYSSLFDTGVMRGHEVELDLARALLQVHTLMEEPPVLTAMHAVNSSFIMDACAGDAKFLALVERGAIRFGRRPDGKAPEELLTDMLARKEDLYLAAWGQSIEKDREARNALLACINEGRSTADLGDGGEVDERLARVRDLLRAISTAKDNGVELVQEKSYAEPFKGIFEAKVRKAAESAAPGHSSLINVLKDLAGGRKHDNRTDVYRAIDERQCSPELKRELKVFVDTFHNERVAESIGRKDHYHSAFPGEVSRLARDVDAEVAGIVRLETDEVAPLSGLSFQWKEILALAPSAREVRGKHGAKEALEELAHRYARRPIVVPVLLEEGLQEFGKAAFTVSIGAAAGAVLGAQGAQAEIIAFAGKFGEMLLGVVGAAFGAGLGISGLALVRRHRFRRAHKILTGIHSKVSAGRKRRSP